MKLPKRQYTMSAIHDYYSSASGKESVDIGGGGVTSAMKKRRLPSWMMTPITQKCPTRRVIPPAYVEMKDELWGLREIVWDEEPEEYLRDFLENEVQMVHEAMQVPYFDDEGEMHVFSEIRRRAVAVEAAIFKLMTDDDEWRSEFESWRWDMYRNILESACTLSRIRGASEAPDE
ncbi:hypothetical protein T484DRAFT_1754961 [Baffinella frigidus]|nr:hypothetical protein T484DRAFT_1754961 [Cryptophyta sp. CCMP2293]